jgi:hypothetical protein
VATTEQTRADAHAHADEAVARARDVNVRGVLLFGLWLAVAAILVQVGVWALYRVLARQESARERPLPPLVASNLQRTPPEPRLEPLPLAPRAKLMEEENGILTTYGWVDKSRGLVRLPIDRAMELLVQQGLPPSKPMAAAAPLPAPGAAPAAPTTPAAPEAKR